MFYKKIILLFFIILALIIGVGVYVLVKNYEMKTPLINTALPVNNTGAPVMPPDLPASTPTSNIQHPTSNLPVRDLTELNQEVERQITVKVTKIREQAADRAYTADELNFIDNPRKNVINSLLADKKINQAEWDLLNK